MVWEVLCLDPWTLKHGYRLQLCGNLPLTTMPSKHLYSEENQTVLHEAVQKLDDSKVMYRIPIGQLTSGFYSDIFLVLKKASKELRMISSVQPAVLISTTRLQDADVTRSLDGGATWNMVSISRHQGHFSLLMDFMANFMPDQASWTYMVQALFYPG